jgi:cytochrome c biogenesis protein CcmG, thiol:disulfide interchange protein DsbE
MKSRIVWLPFIFFAALVVLFLFRLFAGDPSRLPSMLIGKAAPALNLPALPGILSPALTSELLKGQDITLVNIWASWCVPCRDEHPQLMQLAKREGVKIVGINYKDDPEQALKFLNQLGNPYSAIGMDRNGHTGIEWGVYGVPETFIVDHKGIIQHKLIGALSSQKLNGLKLLD